jgi:hypothetical protein
MEAALRRDRLTLTGLMRRAGRPVCDEGSNPSVRNDRSRVSELRVEQRERRMELVEAARGVSSFMRDVERPAFDWIDPVLKRVVARGDTWRDAIAEHGNLLGRAIGANRRNGDEGKALVRWMEEQTGVLYDLLDRGTLPGVAAGGVQSVASGTSAVSNTSVENEDDGAARRAAVVYRDVPLVVVGKPTVLPDLWWRSTEAVC